MWPFKSKKKLPVRVYSQDTITLTLRKKKDVKDLVNRIRDFDADMVILVSGNNITIGKNFFKWLKKEQVFNGYSIR